MPRAYTSCCAARPRPTAGPGDGGTLDALGVGPAIGVGYGLAEITGLAWAGCIPMAEAARLVAQRGQVLRACACGTAAMARVTADTETARALSAAGRLHIAAYEGRGRTCWPGPPLVSGS